MDTNKQLVEKFVNGEITEEQFDAETSKLTPEEKTALEAEAASKLPTAVEKLKGVRRGINKIEKKDEVIPPTPVVDPVAARLRQENYETARETMFSELGIVKDEDKVAFEEDFKKHDTGGVNVPNIVKDMRAFYASQHPEEFFKLRNEKLEREAEAQELIARDAGGGGGGGGGSFDPTKISKEAKQLMEDSKKIGRVLTPEEAQRRVFLAQGGGKIG